jgi:hypothetical protein
VGSCGKRIREPGGKYLDNCPIARPWDPELDEYSTGYASWAYNTEGEARLCGKTFEILKLKDE